MMLCHAVQLAADLYIKQAYPEGPPEKVQEKTNALNNMATNEQLLSWDLLEHENNRYSLRLGNKQYPHMKLVFLVEGNCNLFYVDAHDSHFQINKSVPGYEGLLTLRHANKQLKKDIEKTWLRKNLPVFGCNLPRNDQNACKLKLDVIAIDDEPQILDMLNICGRSIGLSMRCATSVKHGKKAIEQKMPDAVLCDLMMPEESGDVLASWIHQHYPDLPVFYITGHCLNAVDTSLVKGVLQKPFTVKDLSQALESVVQK